MKYKIAFLSLLLLLFTVKCFSQSFEGISNTGSLNIPSLTFQTDKFSLVPEILDFGNVPPGTGKIKFVYFINNSSSVLSIDNVSKPLGPGARFFNITSQCIGKIIEPGKDLKIGILFTPEKNGSYNTTLTLDAGGEIFELPIKGEGESITNIDVLLSPENLYINTYSKNGASIKWDAVAGAINYALSRSEIIGETGKQIYYGPSTGYIDQGAHLTPGKTYYYSVKTENSLGFSNPSVQNQIDFPHTNSQSNLSFPDVTPVSVIASKTEWKSGTFQTVKVQAFNLGNEKSGTFFGKLYMSKTRSISGWDTKLYPRIEFSSIEMNEFSNEHDVVIKVPEIAAGEYFLGVSLNEDMLIDEIGSYDNNFKLSNQVIRIDGINKNELPDLNGDVSFLYKETYIGQSNKVKFSVYNHSLNFDYTYFNCKMFLSTDKILSGDDIRVRSWFEDQTISMWGKNQEVDIYWPDNLSEGDYYLIMKVDYKEEIPESNEDNNIVVSENTSRFQSLNDKVKISGSIIDMEASIKSTVLEKGLEGVVLHGFPEEVKTDAQGYYEVYVKKGFSGIISPEKRVDKYYFEDYYFFIPKKYENVSSNLDNQDYITFQTKDIIKKILKHSFVNTSEGNIPYESLQKEFDKIYKLPLNVKIDNTYVPVSIADGVKYMGEIQQVYKVLYVDEYSEYSNLNEIMKSFKLMNMITSKVNIGGIPVGKLISPYFSVGVEILESYENILAQREEQTFDSALELTLKLTKGNSIWTIGGDFMKKSEYTNNGKMDWLKITWYLYDDVDGKLTESVIPVNIDKYSGTYNDLTTDFIKLRGNFPYTGKSKNLTSFLKFEFIDSGNAGTRTVFLPLNKKVKEFSFNGDYNNPIRDVTVELLVDGNFYEWDLSNISFYVD